jgi:hypothetical protein
MAVRAQPSIVRGERRSMPEITAAEAFFLVVMCLIWLAGTAAVLVLGQRFDHAGRH